MVGAVHHGDRLEVLETRRRFVRLRTDQGIEGWADASLLLSQQQVDELAGLAAGAAKLVSQGKATVFEALNMHTDSSRAAPSFHQIPDGGEIEVLAHRVAPHTGPAPAPKLAVTKRAAPAPKGKKSKAAQDPLWMPGAPGPPSHWEALSVPRAADLAPSPAPAHPAAKPAVDDWYLVRTRDGKAGWVLARMVNMSIPDEVAKYAEGNRITAYVSLGEVKDRDQVWNNWLWATSSAGVHPYEFDSFRVFVWSTRRHHYETAFVERNVKGYYPLEAVNLPDRSEKGFSVVVEEKDGSISKRTYAFSGYHIRMLSKVPYEPSAGLPAVNAPQNFDPPGGPEMEPRSWFSRVEAWWKDRK